ncbi:hypothetical protein HDU97_005680 [Phlyctochytrium planicorne]|nr:hypothetical protein HDU97_005680 [Phlyctochytrium planicorne]
MQRKRRRAELPYASYLSGFKAVETPPACPPCTQAKQQCNGQGPTCERKKEASVSVDSHSQSLVYDPTSDVFHPDQRVLVRSSMEPLSLFLDDISASFAFFSGQPPQPHSLPPSFTTNFGSIGDADRKVVWSLFESRAPMPFEVFDRTHVKSNFDVFPVALRDSDYDVLRFAGIGDFYMMGFLLSMAQRMTVLAILPQIRKNRKPLTAKERAELACWRTCIYLDNWSSVTSGMPRQLRINSKTRIYIISAQGVSSSDIAGFSMAMSEIYCKVKKCDDIPLETAQDFLDHAAEFVLAEDDLKIVRYSLPSFIDIQDPKACVEKLILSAPLPKWEAIHVMFGFFGCEVLLHRSRALLSFELNNPDGVQSILRNSVVLADKAATNISSMASAILSADKKYWDLHPVSGFCLYLSSLFLMDYGGTMAEPVARKKYLGMVEVNARLLVEVDGKWHMARPWVQDVLGRLALFS